MLRKGDPMKIVDEDRFIVYLRWDGSQPDRPDCAEWPLTTCATYEEARRIQREFRHTSRDCVIRYIGPVGGGD
jgi:hypothetical protein